MKTKLFCIRVFSSLFFSAGLMGVFLAFEASAQTVDGSKVPDLIASENYKIGPGDVIDVIVSKNDTLTRTGARVSDRGTIQLPMLEEDVPAACMTERQFADLIKEKYKRYLVNPFVTVAVREFNANPVALIGAVHSPGRFQVQRPMRVLELLTFVNGPTPTAGRNIEIIRNLNRPFCNEGNLVVQPVNDGEDLISLELENTLKGVETANPFIRAGDIIRVVEADQLNAYIQGNIRSAMAIPLKDPVTLTQAVAIAGGLTEGADAEKIKIRRQVPDSINRSEMIVSLKAINQGKRDDVLLQPNDIIDVPGPSGGRKILKGIMDRLIPTVTQLPLRVIY